MENLLREREKPNMGDGLKRKRVESVEVHRFLPLKHLLFILFYKNDCLQLSAESWKEHKEGFRQLAKV